MAEDAATNRATDAPEGSLCRQTFALNIISPSAGVESPLNFTDLPITMTVKELKDKIRNAILKHRGDALPGTESQLANEAQRLIHRGRMLSRDDETMAGIFGEETLVSSAAQALHLVLKPSGTDRVNEISSNDRGGRRQTSQSAEALTNNANDPANGQEMRYIPPHFAYADNNQSTFPPNQLRQEQLQQVEQSLEALAARVQHLQRESRHLEQHMLAIRQRRQALDSANSAHDEPAIMQQAFSLPTPGYSTTPTGTPYMHHGQAQPAPSTTMPNMSHIHAMQQALTHSQRPSLPPQRSSGADEVSQGLGALNSNQVAPNAQNSDQRRTITQSGVDSNGQRWVVNINQSTHTIQAPQTFQQQLQNPILPPNVNLAPEVQAILRGFDRNGLRQGENIQRPFSTPPTSSQRVPVAQSPATRPGTPGTGPLNTPSLTSLNSPDEPPPQPAPSSFPIINRNMVNSITHGSTTSPAQPEVYLLSNPTGPSALLLGPSGVYYTPRNQVYQSNSQAASSPETPQPTVHRGLRQRHHRAVPAEPARAGVVPPVDPVRAAAGVHHGNPPAAAAVAQIWPTLWLIVRLGAFIWFFASGHNSWYRTFIVTGLAIIIFVINTGLLHGAADHIWAPMRRYLDGLIPLADPNLAPAQFEQPGQRQATDRLMDGERQNEPDPTTVAQELLDQRRRIGINWITERLRRAEHSVLLFVASLVPGVGERHIAAREQALRHRENADTQAQAAEQPMLEENGQDAPQRITDQNEHDGAEADGERQAVPAQALIM